MARTEAGRQLTEQHRQGQLRIRAQALQSYTELWPIWEGDEDSFLKLVVATVILAKTYHSISSTYAGSYFQSYRMAEGAPGDAVARLAEPVDEAAVRTSMYVTGQTGLRDALKSGKSPEEARDVAFTRTSGSVSRHVLSGGRGTILKSVAEDKAALGWTRVTDGNPCAFCALLAGRGPVYKEEGTADFQAHDHCVPAGTLVSGPLPELGFRRWYEGELVVIRLAGGGELSITPNHPVLTDQGWVEAGLLREGEYVGERAGADLDALRVPHEDDVPTPIEDVWGSPSMDWLRTVPVAPEHFHGDGGGTKGDVEVKAAHRFLAEMVDAQFGQVLAKPVGARARFAAIAGLLARQRELAAMFLRLLASSHDGMGVRGLPLPLLGGESGRVQGACFLDASPFDPGPAQPSSHHGSADTVPFGEGFLGDPLPVLLDKAWRNREAKGARSTTPGPRFNPPPLESKADLLRLKADLGCRLLERLSGGIELRRVVELRRVRAWSGHVYNLQTVEGWYDANGMVVSNCGCTVQPSYDRKEPWPGRSREFHDLYNEATLEAHEAGELSRGTSNDLLNAFRRKYEAQRHQPSRSQ